MGDAAVATAWQLRLMALRFVAGLLYLVVLCLGTFFSLALFRIPFVTLCSHFYAGIINNTRIGRGIACCGGGGRGSLGDAYSGAYGVSA